MAYVLFVALCGVWGTYFILMKKATLWFSPVSVGALRVMGGALLLGFVHVLSRRKWPVRREDYFPILLVALFGYVIPFVIQPALIQRCGSGFIGMMVSFVPLLTIVVSVPMLGVYPTPRQLFGAVGGLACLMLILMDGIDRRISVLDIAIASCVPLLYAICNTYVKRRFTGLAPLPLALCCLILAFVFLLLPAMMSPTVPTAQFTDLPLAMISVAALGILGTGFGALVFTKLLQDQGPLFAGMVTYLIPTIALVWAWFDGEAITPKQLGALVGVLSMVAIVQYGAAKSEIVE
jgi:drug/metabolite transporter (DMT)-like permease